MIHGHSSSSTLFGGEKKEKSNLDYTPRNQPATRTSCRSRVWYGFALPSLLSHNIQTSPRKEKQEGPSSFTEETSDYNLGPFPKSWHPSIVPHIPLNHSQPPLRRPPPPPRLTPKPSSPQPKSDTSPSPSCYPLRTQTASSAQSRSKYPARRLWSGQVVSRIRWRRSSWRLRGRYGRRVHGSWWRKGCGRG